MLQVECGFSGRSELLVGIRPSLNVQIGLDPSYSPKENSKPELPTNEYHALIDTGAQESCIDSSVATILKLPIVDEKPVSGAHSPDKVNVHMAHISYTSIPFRYIWGFLWNPHNHIPSKSYLPIEAF